MTTSKKTSKSSTSTKKTAPKKKEVLKPRKGVEKISDDKLGQISGGAIPYDEDGGGGSTEGGSRVSWAVDRS